MSGPKVSIYEMSAKQRQNLRAQLNCLQRSIVCCEEIKKAISYLNGVNSQIQSLLSTFDIINQRTGDSADEIAILNDLQSVLPKDCLSYMEQRSNIPALQTDKITITDAELVKKKSVLAKLQELQNIVVKRQGVVEDTLNTMDKKARQGVNEAQNAIAEDIAGVQSFFIPPTETDGEKFEAEKKQIEEHLHALSLCNDYPDDFKNEVLSVVAALLRVTTKERLSTFQSITIHPLLNKIDAARVRVQKEKRELEELKSRYDALCSVAGVPPEEFSSAEGTLEQVKNKVSALEKQVVMQREQEYISDCVNEVMSEMGYDIIGNRSVTKKSGKRFRNELFSYGDGTAINVTYDSKGQIAMELGGIDRADRIPTSSEANVLCEDMESFCSDFRDFEERLKAKGVLMKARISMAPPTDEYATIINVSDYTITALKPISKTSVKEIRPKTASKHTMLREDN